MRGFRAGAVSLRPIDFYFDLGSPYAYLAAERLHRDGAAVAWRPVLLGAIFGLRGHGSWSQTPARAVTWAGGDAFALACFRRAYARGEDLADLAVLEAAARDAGLDPGALREAIADPGVKLRLKDRTAHAWAAGVTGVPSLRVGGRVFYGDDRLDEALTRAGGAPAPRAARPR